MADAANFHNLAGAANRAINLFAARDRFRSVCGRLASPRFEV